MSKKIRYTDKELITLIKGNRSEQNKAITYLLSQPKVIGTIAKLVRNMKGNEQDREDVIQESLLRLMKQIRSDAYQQRSAVTTYWVSVAKFVMIERKRKVKEVIVDNPLAGNNSQDYKASPEEEIIELEKDKEHKSAKAWLFDQLDVACKRILKMVANGYSREEIATEMNYSSVQTAKNNVSKCKKRLVRFALENPDIMKIIKTEL